MMHGGVCIPNVVIRSMLACKENQINIAHINSCSLFPKIAKIRQLFKETCVNVICVSETWLNEAHTDSMIRIDGFNVVRSDRKSNTKKRGGGVCIYIKTEIKFKILNKTALNDNFECIFIELSLPSEKVVVACVYNPPKHCNFSSLKESLELYTPIYENIVIAGDFNINQLKETQAKSCLTNVLSGLGATILNSQPTHYMSAIFEPSCIDLLITNNIEKVQIFDQIGVSGISHHDLLMLSFKVEINSCAEEDRFYRNFKKINVDLLKTDITNQPWEDMWLYRCPNDQVTLFTNLITTLYEKHVPLEKITQRPLVFKSIEFEKACMDRDIAHRRWRRSRAVQDWEVFKSLREKAKLVEKKELREYHSKRFSSELNSKQLWNNIKSLGYKQQPIAVKVCSSNSLNDKFTANSGFSPTYAPISTADSTSNSWFCQSNITLIETVLAVESVKSNAIGTDGICPKFLKLLMPFIGKYVCHIFNSILTSSIFPCSWKCAKIIPIAKTRNPISESDYRPISILPFLSKVFEKVFSKQLKLYLSTNQLLSSCQSGYRSGRSTTTSLINITEDIRKALDRKHSNALVFLDFSKAFDNVDHDLLIHKLRHNFRVMTPACNLLKSYLSNRKQCVVQADDVSSFKNTTCGVPQGSVLGPILFSMYINDLPTKTKFAKCHLFADDVQLHISGPSGKGIEIVQKLNIDLSAIYEWSLCNGLQLNASKSTSMIIHWKKTEDCIWPDVNINNDKIKRERIIQNLGIWFDDMFTWSTQIDNICRQVYSSLNRLWKIAWAIPFKTRLRMVKSLVIPFLTYGYPVFSNISKTLQNKLNAALNACTKFVLGTKKFDRLGNNRYIILGCNLNDYYNRLMCMCMFRVCKLKEPDYLVSHINFSVSTRTRQLTTIRRRTASFNNMFFIKGVKLWNNLPVDIRRIHRLTEFKTKCKIYFQTNN